MAKKQQPKLSYGPNTGLIAGEAQVAASEAGLSNVGGAFAEGFGAMFAAVKLQEKQRQNKIDAYTASLNNLEQAFFMENASNKQIVRSFLNKQRDEFAKYAEIYENTKDRSALDKMDEIRFSLANLDDQIKVFNTDKAEYLTANEEKQLANGQIYESDFFTDIYTNDRSFIITERGDISFETGGKKNVSKLYKDHAGNWINKNNISEEFNLKLYDNSYAAGEQGKSFNRNSTYRSISSNLKGTGADGLMAMITTDLTSDDSSLTFQEQWTSGDLDKKFYKNRKVEDGFDWMFEKENSDELRGLFSDYLTDVMEDGYNEGRRGYKDPNEATVTNDNPYGIPKEGLRLGDLVGSGYQIKVRQDLVTDYIDRIKTGRNFTFLDNNYTYEDGNWYENRGTDDEFKYETVQAMTDDVFKTGGKYFDGLTTEIPINPETGKPFVSNVTSGSVTPIRQLQDIFALTEDKAILELKKIFPPGYSFKERGADIFGIDKVEIYDNSQPPVSLGTFGFDYENPQKANTKAAEFYEEFKNVLTLKKPLK